MTDTNDTGYWNAGYRNTGSWNTGYGNTGNWNTGDYNTGDWNKSNFHVGCFNTTDAEKIYCFNTLIHKVVWDKALKPSWLYEARPKTWVCETDMSAQEKHDNPTYKTNGGYLRTNDLKEEWRKAYEEASPEDIQAVRDLPAFDYDVFEEITGLDLRETPEAAPCEGREIEIDGVMYVLKAKE